MRNFRRDLGRAILFMVVLGCGTEALASEQADVPLPKDLYLDLMKRSLTDLIYENEPKARKARIAGRDWPSRAYTMIGTKRLDNLQECVERALEQGIPGDFLEAGSWRGGATIFMRAILKAHGVTDRKVWVADSFEGLPPPNPEKYPADKGLHLSNIDALAVDVEQVRQNFHRYRLLDDQVVFLKGWFKDTLPTAPIDRLAVLRIDADLYESTTDALEHLYDKVSPGGCIIIDDLSVQACKKAVRDFRERRGIQDKIETIDWTGVYWVKSEPAGEDR